MNGLNLSSSLLLLLIEDPKAKIIQIMHIIEARTPHRAHAHAPEAASTPRYPSPPERQDQAQGHPNPIVKIKPKGTPAPASPSPVSSPSSEEAVRSRSLHGLISNGGGGSGLRFTIPKAARTKPVAREARAERSEEGAEAEAMAEVASALRAVGEGFLRVEERRLQMALQMEKERMESEMKRTQTLLDAQQLFIEAFLGKQQHKKAKGVSSAAAAAMDED